MKHFIFSLLHKTYSPIIIFATLILPSPLSLADEINLFIVTGQSNARTNYALGIQSTLKSSRAWENVVVYHSARFGNWLSSWVSGTDNNYSPASNFTEDLWAQDESSELQQLIMQLEGEGHTVIVSGFFWFQGEGDTGSPSSQAEYSARLTWMIDTLRTKYGEFDLVITLIDWNHDLPDDLAANGRTPEDVEAIREAQIEAATFLDAATYDSRGESRTDVWHIGDTSDPLGNFTPLTNLGAAEATIMIDRSQCPADINGDGNINFYDISSYIQLYNNGCP